MADKYEPLRRISENAQGKVDNATWICFGVVKKVRKADRKIVATMMPDEVDTGWLRTYFPAANGNHLIGMLPEIGSTVLVLFIGADKNNGIVLSGGFIEAGDVPPTITGDHDVVIADPYGGIITMSAAKISMYHPVKVEVDAPLLVLNGGTQPIARAGDPVGTPSGPGTITSGNTSILA